ncbi:MAG: hypothetical protein NUV74_00185 [Candidatus Brocadiaceae bacterium]|nr:hypothetical protein [Candidatus Brocadiaceae bacterium]
MSYITPEQVLFIHYRIIEETGGSHGIRDLTLLQSALARPMATFDENDLYPDIFSKAATLMHSIIKRIRDRHYLFLLLFLRHASWQDA